MDLHINYTFALFNILTRVGRLLNRLIEIFVFFISTAEQ